MNKIKVSENQRFLVREDGTPFFYLGDTAWELFHRLTLEEAKTYLAKRADQRFTVIQAVALAELDGLNDPNRNGDHPLIDNDPAKPNEKYFAHVDAVVAEANRLGLVIGFLPTWGDKWNKKWGEGPEVFTVDNARGYGEYLGKRYRDADLIWIVGGDRPIENDTHLAINRAIAEGLRAGDGGQHLITLHPMGGFSSSAWVHAEAYLDFNSMQSGHGSRNGKCYEMIAHDLSLDPPKPTFDMEPPYENHPMGWQPEKEGWFNDFDVRKALYWSVFAGGFGVTYGCHDVWQFRDQGRSPIGFARNFWHEVLALPGAWQVRHLRKLIESRPMLSRVRDHSLVVDAPTDPGQHVEATRDAAGSYAFAYFPVGGSYVIDPTVLKRGELRASWFSPRSGDSIEIGVVSGTQTHSFETPGWLDWVLVLDDPKAGLELPGTSQ